MHCHERLAEVLLILKGSGRYTVDLRRYEVAAGDVVLCSGGALFLFISNSDVFLSDLIGVIGNEGRLPSSAVREVETHRPPGQFLDFGADISHHGFMLCHFPSTFLCRASTRSCFRAASIALSHSAVASGCRNVLWRSLRLVSTLRSPFRAQGLPVIRDTIR